MITNNAFSLFVCLFYIVWLEQVATNDDDDDNNDDDADDVEDAYDNAAGDDDDGGGGGGGGGGGRPANISYYFLRYLYLLRNVVYAP